MLSLPPGWSGLHPFIVRLPIMLLLVAPFLAVAGIALSAAKRRLFLGSALALMVLGTAMTFVAVATGEAALRAVCPTPAFEVALVEHRTLAETTRELFSVLTLGFAALLFVPKLLRREPESHLRTALFAVYLVFYATGALFLVHTAFEGGRLVRELRAQTAATYQSSVKEGAK